MTLTTPVEFRTRIARQEMTATITEVLTENPLHNGFHVTFGNGFEDDFYIVDNFVSGEKPGSSIYAKAIKDDLKAIESYQPGRQFYYIWGSVDGVLTNIWVVETRRDEEPVFSVYYNGKFHFYITKEKNGWTAQTTRHSTEKLNREVAQFVCEYLDKLN